MTYKYNRNRHTSRFDRVSSAIPGPPLNPNLAFKFEVIFCVRGVMCQKLGIRIMAASSPQAKGRVERNHGIHQDRLIKKLRRKGIASYRAANEFLEKEYLPQHNRRFA